MTIDEMKILNDAKGPELEPSDELRRQVQAAVAKRAELRQATGLRAHRRLLAPALAAVACLALIAGLLISNSGPSRVEPASAAEVLQRAAAAGVAVPPGKFLYTRTANVGPASGSKKGADIGVTLEPRGSGNFIYRSTSTEQRWVDAHGNGRLVVRPGAPQFYTERDREAWRKAGSPRLSPPLEKFDTRLRASDAARLVTGVEGLPSGQIEHLADQPRQLLSLLKRRIAMQIERQDRRNERTYFKQYGRHLNRPTPEWVNKNQLEHQIEDALGGAFSQPKVRLAMFRVAGLLEGARLIPSIEDHLGRKAVGVQIGSFRLLFDPTSYALRESQVLSKGPGKDGAIPGLPIEKGAPEIWATVVESGVVDSVREIPG